MSRYILGVTGASGAIYAKRTAMHLKRLGHHVTALVTPPGKGVIRYEEQSALFDYVDAQPDVTDFFAECDFFRQPCFGRFSENVLAASVF